MGICLDLIVGIAVNIVRIIKIHSILFNFRKIILLISLSYNYS